ncbi:uncharacterized protein FIBRA_08826 [Fibroporia radiculosa]|uniref:Uncharacterized protein n=1 Tax=Fibroporia radiculosa TaxID=599839 RepID=J4ICK1_9APHY|nr:uncharacterized protein FIBRA_08826 [Fibroporia radiculosa]CCM06551.1 predicted protein [Fibroporia radiculosa]
MDVVRRVRVWVLVLVLVGVVVVVVIVIVIVVVVVVGECGSAGAWEQDAEVECGGGGGGVPASERALTPTYTSWLELPREIVGCRGLCVLSAPRTVSRGDRAMRVTARNIRDSAKESDM